MICFDMDGTIADLYNVPNWLECLIGEDPTPYEIAKPLWNMDTLRELLLKLIDKGWEIRVITWLSKDSRKEYKRLTREAKMRWLKQYNFPTDKVHMIAYGTTKADCIRKGFNGHAILVDDNDKVREGWTLGRTINPKEGTLLKELENLLEG